MTLCCGERPGRRLLHEVAGSVSIAQHSAGKCVKPREQCGKAVVLRVPHVKPPVASVRLLSVADPSKATENGRHTTIPRACG